MTHRERIRKAFRELRKQGVVARMAFSCCSSCGHYELSEQGHGGFVFWNRQSERMFNSEGDLTDTLYLQWAGPATPRAVVRELRAVGLTVYWGGTEGKCVEVLP